MLPEFGFVALLLAMVMAILQGSLSGLGAMTGRGEFDRLIRPLTYAVFVLLAVALSLLGYAFAQDDFSVAYVAQHSNTHLPLFFKLAAVWGGHEGSMLFFVFALSFWAVLVAACSRRVDTVITTHVLVVLSGIIAAFAFFTVFASNPFLRQFPVPFEGRDLNPMLQDVALIFHPPLLYIGYVGFAVSFAYAMAALLSGRLDGALVRWSRPWTLAAWGFLTAGIALGSWWAYYELGWGGWWFWDPVENASLLPWLAGTALLHAMIVCEKRGVFGYLVLLLSIFTFSLSILGTFMVRSGILSSVHAFAIDPGRGILLLLLLGTLLTVVLSLFALRADTRPPLARFDFFSKEGLLGATSALFCVMTVCVLLGTFYPLLYKVLGFGSLSVGAPYFNRVFVPLSLGLLVFMPFAPRLRWKAQPVRGWRNQWPWLTMGAVAGIALCWYHERSISVTTWTVCILASWIVLAHLAALIRERSARRIGMYLAHFGVAITAIGAAQVSQYADERLLAMTKNETYTLGAFEFVLEGSEPLIGPNYTAEQLIIRVKNHDGPVAYLRPERRHYTVRDQTMNETGIAWGLGGDLYAVFGEKLSSDTYTVHLQYKPMVRWIWLGAVLMVLGSLLALLNRASFP